MDTYYITLANKRNRFPRAGAASPSPKKGVQGFVMDDARAGSPYMFYMPTGGAETEEEAETYFVPKKTWRKDADDAQFRLARRQSLCRSYFENERLHFIVRILAQHSTERRLDEAAFIAAFGQLGITHKQFLQRAFHNFGQVGGSAAATVEYETLVAAIDEYVSGTTTVTTPRGERKPRWRAVVQSCYDLFDPPDDRGRNEGYIAVRDLKIQRGMSPQRIATGDPSLITFPMVKALLDVSQRTGLRQIIDVADLEREWETGGGGGIRGSYRASWRRSSG